MEEQIIEFLSVSYGYGDGYGDGDGIKSFDGETVYIIDGMPTILRSVRETIASGAILNTDLTLTPCWIMKNDQFFAHGETLHAAARALADKILSQMPEEERIGMFTKQFRPGLLYKNSEFYEWHHRLTGSCDAGRRQFARDHGIDLADSMTPEAFIRLTVNAYGGSVIRKLAEHYPDALRDSIPEKGGLRHG